MSERDESTERFGGRAAHYDRARPAYPSAAIDHICRRAKLDSRASIADIGSGPGILSRPLLERGYTVFGVEPNDDMRRIAESALGARAEFHSVAGTAEATTLAAKSIDLLMAGQAFHWFDAEKVAVEFRRIVSPGGGLALLWNSRRLNRTPFLEAYEAFLIEWGTDYTDVSETYEASNAIRSVFGTLPDRIVFSNEQVLDREGLRARILSCSYIPEPVSPDFDAMLRAIDALYDSCADGERVVLEYATTVYVGELL